MALAGFQRKHLRKLAHELKPLIHVGEAGVSDGLLRALRQALLDHELVKVRLRQPEDKKSEAEALARAAGAELCGLVGHTAILYARHPENPAIEIPQRVLNSTRNV